MHYRKWPSFVWLEGVRIVYKEQYEHPQCDGDEIGDDKKQGCI
jgi:hypothetical protein